MCVKNGLVRLYAVIHHPTHMARPVVLGVHKASEWNRPLFEKYITEAAETIEKYGGGNKVHLTKRDIERWGCNVPVGARAQVIEFDVPKVIL
jgi:hypothetical protein